MGLLKELSGKARDYEDRLKFLMGKGTSVDRRKRALSPVSVERGRDPSVLIIAFTGHGRMLQIPIYEFFDITKVLGYSRILLWDQYGMHYHHGIDRKRPDWPSLIQYLKSEIAQLGPKKIFCVGTSAGGYAAVIAGHYLRADYVHAFSPQTVLRASLREVRQSSFPLSCLKLSISRKARREIFDLAPMLRDPNGKTEYFIHYGAARPLDCKQAEHVSGLPFVITLGYPSDAHAVAVFLAKKGFLPKLFDVANQERVVEMGQVQFGEKLVIRTPS